MIGPDPLVASRFWALFLALGYTVAVVLVWLLAGWPFAVAVLIGSIVLAFTATLELEPSSIRPATENEASDAALRIRSKAAVESDADRSRRDA